MKFGSVNRLVYPVKQYSRPTLSYPIETESSPIFPTLSAISFVFPIFAIKTSKFFRGIFLDCRLGQTGSSSTVCYFRCTLNCVRAWRVSSIFILLRRVIILHHSRRKLVESLINIYLSCGSSCSPLIYVSFLEEWVIWIQILRLSTVTVLLRGLICRWCFRYFKFISLVLCYVYWFN